MKVNHLASLSKSLARFVPPRKRQRKRRTIFSTAATHVLQQQFASDCYPDNARLLQLAQLIGHTDIAAIQVRLGLRSPAVCNHVNEITQFHTWTRRVAVYLVTHCNIDSKRAFPTCVLDRRYNCLLIYSCTSCLVPVFDDTKCHVPATEWCQRYLPCYLFSVSNSVCFSSTYCSLGRTSIAAYCWF